MVGIVSGCLNGLEMMLSLSGSTGMRKRCLIAGLALQDLAIGQFCSKETLLT